MKKQKIAIIIPAFNEELTVGSTIEAFAQELPDTEIVVVDNNSCDRTQDISKQKLMELGCKGAVIFEKRQGKGFAVRRAFSEIDADIYVMVDADMTYSPDDLKKLIAPVLSGEEDIVVGDRHAGNVYKEQNKRLFHDFGNRLVSKIINRLFQSELNDIFSGYRVMNRKFVKNFPVMSLGFELETEMTLHTLDKRFRIREIPVGYRERPEGSASKLNTFSDGMRVLKTIFLVFKDYRPLLFYSFFAALFFITGFLIGLPVLIEYARIRYIYRVPSAILATGLMTFSIIFLTVGMTLDTVAKYQRFNYELRLLESEPPPGKDKGHD